MTKKVKRCFYRKIGFSLLPFPFALWGSHRRHCHLAKQVQLDGLEWVMHRQNNWKQPNSWNLYDILLGYQIKHPILNLQKIVVPFLSAKIRFFFEIQNTKKWWYKCYFYQKRPFAANWKLDSRFIFMKNIWVSLFQDWAFYFTDKFVLISFVKSLNS